MLLSPAFAFCFVIPDSIRDPGMAGPSRSVMPRNVHSVGPAWGSLHGTTAHTDVSRAPPAMTTYFPGATHDDAIRQAAART
jgi:hypothetical protein